MGPPIGSEGSVRAGEGSRVGSVGVRGGLRGGRRGAGGAGEANKPQNCASLCAGRLTQRDGMSACCRAPT